MNTPITRNASPIQPDSTPVSGPATLPMQQRSTAHRSLGPVAIVMTIALLASGAAVMPVRAQQVGWHPATSTQPRLPAGIDPNTFIVGHPASPTTRGGRANGEHPAVMVSRDDSLRGIDPNTFIVQPPTPVTWIATPPQDDSIRYAQTPRADASTAQ